MKIENAPLDNNVTERALKIAIRNRKNSFFYKTLHGALIGDILMSVIYTASLVGVNPFEYLIAIQQHRSQVFKSPKKWMPWNYQENLIRAAFRFQAA